MGSLPYNLDPNKGPVGQYWRGREWGGEAVWSFDCFRLQNVSLHITVRGLPRPPSRHGHLMVKICYTQSHSLVEAWTISSVFSPSPGITLYPAVIMCGRRVLGAGLGSGQKKKQIRPEISKFWHFTLQLALLKYSSRTGFVITIIF